MTHIYLESYGVRLDVEVQDEPLIPFIMSILPPGWQELSAFPEHGHFTIAADQTGGYDVLVDGDTVVAAQPRDVAVHVLDATIRARVAAMAQDHIFVHAGVAVWDGRAIVMPASSFAGKTTLVAALVRAGASYFSDEFAVLDRQGKVHPYARALSIRGTGERWGVYSGPGDLGGEVGGDPVAAALVIETKYVPGVRWQPDEQGHGAAALSLLVNAVPTRERSEETMDIVARAATEAKLLTGDRGEADETAELILSRIRSQSQP